MGCIFKCAILLFSLPLQAEGGSGNFRQNHLGNIAGGSTQGIDGLQGIETADIPEIIFLVISAGVNAAANQKHIANTALQQGFENGGNAFIVQGFQETAFPVVHQLLQIVGDIILHHILGGRN
ncbi:MAG: hypothetical protein U0N82_11520 [Oscillospiraceae bacterium]